MTETSDTLMQRAQLAQREHRLADARQDLQAAIDLLRVEGNGLRLAQALRSLGELERKLRYSESARAHYEESVAILRKCSEPLKLAHTVRHLGDVHHDSGRADLAALCYGEALALYRGHPGSPLLDLANAIRSMAVLKQEAGHRLQAIALWSEARELYSNVREDAGVAECTARLAKLAE
jgi:tetratricopeptide (TPR) repeat protein